MYGTEIALCDINKYDFATKKSQNYVVLRPMQAPPPTTLYRDKWRTKDLLAQFTLHGHSLTEIAVSIMNAANLAVGM
jgi:hypothetical protein